MSEDNKPGPGDRVRVTFEAIVETVDDHGRVGRVMGNSPQGAWLSYIPEFAAVEVLVRADDPKRALHGAAWQHDDTSVVVKVADDQWVSIPGGVGFDDADLATGEWRAVGAVPGTPAAEAEDKHPCTLTADCDAEGHFFACRSLADTPFDEQRKRVAREPRVFSSDGPEPPEAVQTLEWLDRDSREDYQFLLRTDVGWLWSRASDHLSPVRAAAPNSWRSAVAVSPGRYREVVS